MYATVRELTVKPSFKEENKRRVHDELLPQFQKIPGFIDYFLMYTTDETEFSVGVCEDKKGCDEINRLAGEFVKKIAPNVHLKKITEGEVAVHAEAPVPV